MNATSSHAAAAATVEDPGPPTHAVTQQLYGARTYCPARSDRPMSRYAALVLAPRARD
jgi:hypothetical protein